MIKSMGPAASTLLFCGSLFTLPWVGVGLIHFLFDLDLGGGLQPSWALLALAIIFLAGEKILSGNSLLSVENLKEKPSPILLISTGALLAVLLSGLGLHFAPSLEPAATGLSRWLKQIIQLLIMFSFMWWAALWVRGIRRWQLTLDLLFWGVAFQVFYSFAQGLNFFLPMPWFSSLEVMFTSNPSILSGSEKLYLNNVLHEIPRLRGTVCEPLYLGNFLLMAWPFLLVWRKSVALRLTLGVLLVVLLILTWSRGAWLGFMGQLFLLVVAFLLKKRQQSKRTAGDRGAPGFRFFPWTLGGGLLLLMVMDIAFGGWIFHRLLATFNNQDWSNLTRLYSMEAAWLAFVQNPVVGVGWGQFAFHFPLLVDPMGLQSQFTWPVVNNFPLQILCETGLVGFVIFFGSGWWLFRSSWNHLCAQKTLFSSSSMVFPAALGVWGVGIQLLSFSQYNLPHIWIGVGLLLAALAKGPESYSAQGNRK